MRDGHNQRTRRLAIRTLVWAGVGLLFALAVVLVGAQQWQRIPLSPGSLEQAGEFIPWESFRACVTRGDAECTNSIGMEFVRIEAGTFIMGSEEGDSDEQPLHEVTISQPFYMGKYEVMQAEWQRLGFEDNSFFNGGDNPIVNVNWGDANRFIEALNDVEGVQGYRLPTEAEWEGMLAGPAAIRPITGVMCLMISMRFVSQKKKQRCK